MSESNGHPLDPIELASLPSDDHRRLEHARQMAGATDQERQAWETELALTDRLRAGLPQVDIPATLERRLLAIPDQQAAGVQSISAQEPSSASAWRRLMHAKMDWRHVAAVLVVAGLVAAYFMWPREAPPPIRMSQSAQKTIIESTIRHHAQASAGGGAALEITSKDPQAVEKALAAHNFDFPVMMLKPSQGELAGGGTCKLGTANAVFTQWHAAGATYTLYEFNGRDLGAPPQFLPTITMPRELWTADAHYTVFIWPGSEGKCCWALVADIDNPQNPFAHSAYGTNP